MYIRLQGNLLLLVFSYKDYVSKYQLHRCTSCFGILPEKHKKLKNKKITLQHMFHFNFDLRNFSVTTLTLCHNWHYQNRTITLDIPN